VKRARKRDRISNESYFPLRFFLSGRWVNAEAAVLLAFFEVPLLRSCWEAILPTRFEVFSFRAIIQILSKKKFHSFSSPHSAGDFKVYQLSFVCFFNRRIAIFSSFSIARATASVARASNCFERRRRKSPSGAASCYTASNFNILSDVFATSIIIGSISSAVQCVALVNIDTACSITVWSLEVIKIFSQQFSSIGIL